MASFVINIIITIIILIQTQRTVVSTLTLFLKYRLANREEKSREVEYVRTSHTSEMNGMLSNENPSMPVDDKS